MRKLLISLLAFGLSSAPAWSAPAKDLSENLRAAMTEIKPKLGKLEPWQSLVFDMEAVPQYSRFVQDYRLSPKGVDADIDLESVKSLLVYNGFGYPSPEAKNIQVVLRSGVDCRTCSTALPLIRTMVKSRLERRGFSAVFPKPELLGKKNLAGSALDERVVDLARAQNSSGALVIEWSLQPADVEHPGEEQFGVRLFQFAKHDAAGGTREWRAERALDVLPEDGFVPTAERLLTDTFTEIGSKQLVAQGVSKVRGEQGVELRIEVAGVRDYAHFQVLQSKLQAALKDWGALEERELSRGQVVWAISSNRGIPELKSALAGMNRVSSDDRSIQILAE